MKRIFFTSLFLVAVIIPYSVCSAQEVIKEKKVMVIVEDGNVRKVVSDTVITSQGTDSIIIRNGKSGLSSDSRTFWVGNDKGAKTVMVTVESDDNKGSKDENSYVIIKSDSAGIKHGNGSGKFIYFNNSDLNKRGEDDKFDVFVHSADNQEQVEAKVKYVIAKNGMVVTVEGDDEAKTKALFDGIENLLEKSSNSSKSRTGSSAKSGK